MPIRLMTWMESPVPRASAVRPLVRLPRLHRPSSCSKLDGARLRFDPSRQSASREWGSAGRGSTAFWRYLAGAPAGLPTHLRPGMS